MSDPSPPFPGTGPTPGQPPGATGPPTGPEWQWTPPPHPSGLSNEVRNWAMAAHLSAFAALVLSGLPPLGPLVVWLLKREGHPFIAEHAREALNFNISMAIYAVVSLVLILVLVGFLLLPAVAITWLVLVVVAAVRASNGQPYRYPITIRFVR